MSYTYKTHGTCSVFIDIDLDGNIVKDVKFTGGCNGNLKGLSKLVQGMTVEEVEQKLQGITCGNKKTSCPDQLVSACKAAQQNSNLQ